ncbi:MAG: ATP-binding protein [Candidatus Magnetominusculus sp. LBB02]|nr:ATP-binding protein [Candidatus Magnetominusculus sp. LBB02]
MLSNEVGGAKVIKEYAELPLLACEPRAVNQCFYHILQNAFHAVAAAENDGVIRIMTSKTGIASELMQIVIEDNGTGMSEEAVRRAFVPFYTTKEVGLGKGLGLSIVDGIVKRHGGSVQLKSKQGSGTTVTIHLPIANELK